MKHPDVINEPDLLLTDAQGIYIPQLFVQNFWHLVLNPEKLEWEYAQCLQGPDGEFYWDAFGTIEREATFANGSYLLQSGDLWLCPEGYEFPE